MNTGQIQSIVANAITKRPPSTAAHYQICYLNNRICCHPVGTNPTPEIIFGTYTENTLIDGFSTTEWGQLAGRIRTFFRQKGIT